MSATTAPKKMTTAELLKNRNTILLEMKLSLEEFAALVTVSYDDRWKSHRWRVQGDERLCYWLHDCSRKRDEGMYSDAEVIEIAYRHFLYIQARQGQMNFCSVYVRDVEEIFVVPQKNYDYVKVNVVKDCLDGLYRYSTAYSINHSGGSAAPSFHSSVTESREDAILTGARQMLESVSKGWQAEQEADKYNPFINKIKNFIEAVEAELRQPSLFG